MTQERGWRSRRGWLCGWAMAVLWAGCATSPEVELLGPALEVEAVRFEGNAALSREELLRHIHTAEHTTLPFDAEHGYQEGLVAVDAQRIEALYQAWGYYSASVVDVRVVPGEDAETVQVTFVVEEGAPTRIREVQLRWEAADEVPEEVRAEVEAAVGMSAGDPLVTERVNNALGSLRQALQTRGYPLARVTGQAEVYEGSRVADVRLRVEAGPKARIGSVEVVGLEGVPEGPVQREVRFALGEPFSPALLQQIEGAVKAMRVFRWVSVTPAESVEDGQIALQLRVSEADPQTLRLGGALTFEAFRWQQSAAASYTHTNPFGELTRLDVKASAGWAELPDPFTPDAHGPVGVLAPQLSRKGLLEDHLLWALQPSASVNVLDGYQFWSVANRLSVSRWFGGVAQLELSHNLRRVDFFGVDAQLDSNTTLLGRDFRDPFVLSFLELTGGLYLTDALLEPTEGVILDLTADLAGGLLQGDYSFGRVLAGVRGWWPVGGPVSLAARVQSGVILPYGAEGGAPLNFKFYLGGANSVRGWGARRLSPQLKECAAGETDCRGIPIGGLTMVQGNFELRLALLEALTLVGFVDMGDVQAAAETWRVEEWAWTAGPGLRVDSPLGLFRLDAGFRLNEDARYPEEPAWGVYFGIGETF